MNEIRKVKRELKLAEWKELLDQQAQSGKKKYEWCKEHGITKDQFYYWQRIVRESIIEGSIVSGGMTTPLQRSATPTPEFTQVNISSSNISSDVAVSIKIGNAELNINNSALPEIIEQTIMAVGKIC